MHRNEIPIASPCPLASDWSSLSGSDQKRFCGQCSRHVYDLSEMTEAAARSLVYKDHVCVRYSHDAQGQILHRGHRMHQAALALGAALATAPAHASTAPSEEPGWLPWLVEMASSWWSTTEVMPPLERPTLTQPVLDPTRDRIVPYQTLGGVPPPPPDLPVRVVDQTGRPHEWVESSCCGRAPFRDGTAEISVGDAAFIEIVGEPESRVMAEGGASVVCIDIDGRVNCR